MLINKKKSWFTLIEVLVATMILATVVFGILRLSNNNTKQTDNLEKNNDMYDIYSNSLECIKSLWFDYLSWTTSTQSINFWTNSDNCLTWAYNTGLGFTWVEVKISFDWQQAWSNNYWVYFTTKRQSSFIDVNTYITSWSFTKKFNYKFYK